MILLDKNDIDLLKHCIIKYKADLIWIINEKEIINIDEALGSELLDVIGDELFYYGFNGDIPNEYGLLLEDLINKISNMFL
ncbi:MAG: hypothetical protein HFE49_03015 [Clostridia bacterium]|nr:hypothetical protein [Clostridia bacterium]